MKTLDFNQMETLQGGSYCGYLGAWVISAGAGYQGDMNDVYSLYVKHCMD